MQRAIAIILVALFYSTGNFGILNVFGIRREVQLVLLVVLTLAVPVGLLLVKRKQLLREPLFWLAVSLFASSLFLQRPFDQLRIDFGILFMVLGFLCLPDRWKENLLRYIVGFSTAFAVAATIQAFVVMSDPDLGRLLATGYSSDSKDKVVEIAHPLGYLGFTKGSIRIGNFDYWRFISFSTEPSVLIYLFVAPGFLALMLPGAMKWCAVPLLGFTALFTFSSTTYLILILTFLIWLLSRWFLKSAIGKKTVIVLAFLPILVGFGFIYYLSSMGLVDAVEAIGNVTQDLGGESNILDKARSSSARIEGIQTIVANFAFFPLGSDVVVDTPLSLPVSNYFVAGVGGLLATLWLAYSIQKSAFINLRHKSSAVRFAASGIISLVLIILTYSDYGWRIPPGYLMLGLIQWKLLQIVNAEQVIPAVRPSDQ